jgi:amidase
MPAYCNGVYGIKPSSGRLPYHLLKGYLQDGAEAVGILCVNGVIAASMRDCELLVRSVSQAEPWLRDPSCAYLPWTESNKIKRPLVFGVISEDHDTSPLPPVRRVLNETCIKLKEAGHEVIDIDFHRSAELSQNAVNFFKIDGGKVLLLVTVLRDVLMENRH